MAEQKEQTQSQKKGFSIALGLVDYINPLTFSINTFLIWNGLHAAMSMPQRVVYLIGLILALVIGIVIPTGKLLVGMGKMEFRLPFILFFLVNAGIMAIGATLLSMVASTKVLIIVLVAIIAILAFLWISTKKFNSAVLFTGTFGYTMIYVSMAIMAVQAGKILPVVFFALACAIMYGLIIFSMKADLTNPKLHWPIEGLNIGCQILFAIGLLILF